MSFAQDSGYTPQTFSEIMNFLREGVNTQFGTSYTVESFVGTNWYKHFYTMAQKQLLNETKTAEIFQKAQQYIALTNEAIQRPSVSAPGLIDSFAAEGYVVSVKPPLEADAGMLYLAFDEDEEAEDYAAIKLEIANLIKQYVVAGIVTMGDEVESLVLSNGQSFDFKFSLPDPTPIILRLTAVASENTLLSIPTDEEIRQAIFDNINARYRLGLNFEPQRYFTLTDAPWSASVLLEYSTVVVAPEPENWTAAIFDSDFDEKLTFGLQDISVVIS